MGFASERLLLLSRGALDQRNLAQETLRSGVLRRFHNSLHGMPKMVRREQHPLRFAPLVFDMVANGVHRGPPTNRSDIPTHQTLAELRQCVEIHIRRQRLALGMYGENRPAGVTVRHWEVDHQVKTSRLRSAGSTMSNRFVAPSTTTPFNPSMPSISEKLADDAVAHP